jgi:hypothetical protein
VVRKPPLINHKPDPQVLTVPPPGPAPAPTEDASGQEAEEQK